MAPVRIVIAKLVRIETSQNRVSRMCDLNFISEILLFSVVCLNFA